MSKKDKPSVVIYCDGSCNNKSSPRHSGAAALLIAGNNVKVVTGFELNSNSHRAEILSILIALQKIVRPCNVTVYNDCQSVIQICAGEFSTQTNTDLYDQISKIKQTFTQQNATIEFRWVNRNNTDEAKTCHHLANVVRKLLYQ